MNQRGVSSIAAAKDRARGFVGRYPDQYRRAYNYGFQYHKDYHDRWESRFHDFDDYYHHNHYRYYYSGWFDHGFYGGYWYPVFLCDNIEDYFVYPVIYWLYADYVDVEYYQAYYGDDWNTYPIADPFPYSGVFFPTDTLRDLMMEVSGLAPALQANFRTSLTNFTASLDSQVSATLVAPYEYSDNDIVVDYYVDLFDQGGNLTGIEIEGMLDHDPLHVPFKAVLDLEDPSQTLVFIPSSQDPDGSAATLDQINQRLEAAGIDPTEAPIEPTTGDESGITDPGVTPPAPSTPDPGTPLVPPVDPGVGTVVS
jgi:hypothetical protein